MKRPLDGIVGNRRVCEQLGDLADAARARGRTTTDHIALIGAGGLGKTYVAEEFAARLGVPFRRTNSATVKTIPLMKKAFRKLEANCVWLLDEFHLINDVTREGLLYDVMSGDDSTDGDDGAEPIKVPPFTLIAATTEGGFTPSMADRFGVKCALGYYSVAELTTIITGRAEHDLFLIDPDAAHMLAVRSQGVPRVAGNRLARATDQAVKARSREKITMAHATAAMDLEEIDALGLGTRDRIVLTVIASEAGEPIGVKSIKAVCGFNNVDQEMSILKRLGLIAKAPGTRGSWATRAAYELLDWTVPPTCPGGKP